MKAIAINPLSSAKGLALTCELCSKPAYIKCADCKVAFYCEQQHQVLDFKGIHQHICSLLVPLRTPFTNLGSEEERVERQAETKRQQAKLLQISKAEARRLLFEGAYDLAIPASLQALRFSMLLNGQDSIEMVSAYLLLGEASTAKWAILKAPECKNTIQSQLHRNFGQLYSAQGFYEKAIHELAQDIYYISLEHGLNDIAVTGGYYQLGKVFSMLLKSSDASAFFDKVVAIWKLKMKDGKRLDSASIAEAVQMLTAINTYRAATNHLQLGATEANYVLAQVYFAAGQIEVSKEFAVKALEVYDAALGREHSLTIEVRGFIKSLLPTGAVSKRAVAV